MEPDNIRNNANLAWIVATVLAVVAILLFVMLLGADKRSLDDVREQIVADCSATDEESRAECIRSLGELEEILLEVRSDISTSPAEEDVAPAE